MLQPPITQPCAFVCAHVFDFWLVAAFNSWLHPLNDEAFESYRRNMSISSPPPSLPQSLASSCCMLARSRSEEWTSTTRTTTTLSPSLCQTSTMWPWWTMTLRSTASTGQTCALRPSRERSLMALESRLWSLLVRTKQRSRIPNKLLAHCFYRPNYIYYIIYYIIYPFILFNISILPFSSSFFLNSNDELSEKIWS